MSITRVQGTSFINTVAGTTISATLNGVAAGNLITVATESFGSITHTATCTDGTAYTKTPNSPASDSGESGRAWLFYLPNCAAGTHVVTVTFSISVSIGNAGIWITEWAGVAKNSPLSADVASTTPGSNSTTINTPSITPSAPGRLLYFALLAGGTVSAVNSPWTQGTLNTGDSDGYILSSSNSATALNVTQSSAKWAAVIGSFLPENALAATCNARASCSALLSQFAKNLRLAGAGVNAEADAVGALFNSGYLRIYDGTQPATADTAITTQNLLAELRFGSTAFASASGGSITANTISPATFALASGTATWARCLKSDGTTPLMDESVGTSNSNIIFDNVTIVSGQLVAVNSFVHTVAG